MRRTGADHMPIRKHVRNGASQNDGHQGIALFDARHTVGVQVRHIHVKDLAAIGCEKRLPKVMEDATLQDGSAVESEVLFGCRRRLPILG